MIDKNTQKDNRSIIAGIAASFYFLNLSMLKLPVDNLLLDAALRVVLTIIFYAATYLCLKAPLHLQSEFAKKVKDAGVDYDDFLLFLSDAIERINRIEALSKQLASGREKKTKKLLQVSFTILQYLHHNPAKYLSYKPFFTIHLEGFEKILENFIHVRDRGELIKDHADDSGIEVKSHKEKIDTVLDELNEFAVHQYVESMGGKTLDLDIDINVMRQSIRAEMPIKL